MTRYTNRINGYNVLRTSVACPERYNVETRTAIIARVYLEEGKLTCHYVPTGEMIYFHQFEDPYKGAFEDDVERTSYLNAIIGVVDTTHKKWVTNKYWESYGKNRFRKSC